MQHVPNKNKSLERQQEESRRANEEHAKREAEFNAQKEQKTKKKTKILAITTIVIIIAIAAIGYAMLSPGQYDSFAKCLTENGAVMYGEDWCKYTNAQKAMFGKSFKHINYEIKSDLRVRPTWVIDGKEYETVQSFERLSALTGCEY